MESHFDMTLAVQCIISSSNFNLIFHVQVCMVSMEKSQPSLSACIAVTDGRITSIIAVPEYIPASVSNSLARTKALVSSA